MNGSTGPIILSAGTAVSIMSAQHMGCDASLTDWLSVAAQELMAMAILPRMFTK